MGSGISIGYYPSAVSLDPVVVDWVTRTVAAGGTIATSTQNIVDAYVKTAKANGYWSILANGLILPFASDAFAGCFTALVIPSGGVLTNNGFTSGDYSLLTGLDPGSSNSVNKFLTSNIQANTIFTGTSAQASVYRPIIRNGARDLIASDQGAGGGNSPPIFTAFAPYNDSTNYNLQIDAYDYSQGTGRNLVSYSLANFPIGLLTVKRLNTALVHLQNGVSLSSVTGASLLPTSRTLEFLGWQVTAPFNSLPRCPTRYLYCGAALTDTQEVQHAANVQTLQTALGRQV